MSEHQDPGAPEYSHITQETMDNAADRTIKLDSLDVVDGSSQDAYRDLIRDPDFKAVSEMQTEAHDTNQLVDIGAERFGLDRQTVANSKELLDALYKLADTEEALAYEESEINARIAGLEKKREQEKVKFAKYIAEDEAKVKEIADHMPDKAE